MSPSYVSTVGRFVISSVHPLCYCCSTATPAAQHSSCSHWPFVLAVCAVISCTKTSHALRRLQGSRVSVKRNRLLTIMVPTSKCISIQRKRRKPSNMTIRHIMDIDKRRCQLESQELISIFCDSASNHSSRGRWPHRPVYDYLHCSFLPFTYTAEQLHRES